MVVESTGSLARELAEHCPALSDRRRTREAILVSRREMSPLLRVGTDELEPPYFQRYSLKSI